MIKQLAHVCLLTNDLAATEDFYCRVLKLHSRFDFYKDNARFGLYLDAGNGTFIEVFKDDSEQSEKASVQNIKHLCFQVDDIEETIQTLRNNDIDISDKKMGADNSWQSWCKDPNGVDIELHQYTDQSLQLTGGICYVQ